MLSVFKGPINGYKFFAIFASFFIVIIGVNIVLAVYAAKTFPGLEVKNSYVASQTFDIDRAAQEKLGWTVDSYIEGQEVVLAITDANGAPVQAKSIGGTFGRPTTVRDDQTPAFVFNGTVYRAPVNATAGQWNLRLEAEAADGTMFRQRIVLHVRS